VTRGGTLRVVGGGFLWRKHERSSRALAGRAAGYHRLRRGGHLAGGAHPGAIGQQQRIVTRTSGDVLDTQVVIVRYAQDSDRLSFPLQCEPSANCPVRFLKGRIAWDRR